MWSDTKTPHGTTVRREAGSHVADTVQRWESAHPDHNLGVFWKHAVVIPYHAALAHCKEATHFMLFSGEPQTIA